MPFASEINDSFMAAQPVTCSRSSMVSYSVGNVPFLIMNSFLLCDAVLHGRSGPQAFRAGIAMALAVFWDAITDPSWSYHGQHEEQIREKAPWLVVGGLG
jgi:hypothetical protein